MTVGVTLRERDAGRVVGGALSLSVNVEIQTETFKPPTLHMESHSQPAVSLTLRLSNHLNNKMSRCVN